MDEEIEEVVEDFNLGCSDKGCFLIVKGLALMGKLSLIFCRGRDDDDEEDDEAGFTDSKFNFLVVDVEEFVEDSCVVSEGDILLGFGGKAGLS